NRGTSACVTAAADTTRGSPGSAATCRRSRSIAIAFCCARDGTERAEATAKPTSTAPSIHKISRRRMSESDPDVDANADGREDSGAGILKANRHDQLAEHGLAVQHFQQPMVDDRREAPRRLVHVERGS